MQGNWRIFLGMILVIALFPFRAGAQEAARDTVPVQEVDVDNADYLFYLQGREQVVQNLIGNVELSQDSIYMYCDSARIENKNYVRAKGNVVIQQGDSITVFSDSLIYDGVTRQADLYGNVVLMSSSQQLFTDSLHYDLNTKLATYTNGATLANDSTQLSSLRGYYYVETDEAYFKDSVVVVDPRFTLRSDTLKFNTHTKTVFFLGPTLISTDSSRIYCESGFYDTENNVAEFQEEAQFVKGEQQAWADTIRYDGQQEEYLLKGNANFWDGERRAVADLIRYEERLDRTFLLGNARYADGKQDIAAPQILYDARNEVYSTRGRSRVSDPPQLLEADQIDFVEEEGLGVAVGNVIWRDTSAQLTIQCGRADYNRKTDYLKASGGRDFGRPLLTSILDGDSLFMASDTLLAIREDTLSSDSARLLIAYHDVRIYKSDLQALCDSLSYSNVDSVFRFYQTPVIWSDTSQFTADTILMQMADEKIDRIFMRNNAFIINSPDEIFFNQVKGKHITAIFKDDNLRQMDVNGNAESVYYARDEAGGYVGVNETICSDMLLFFGDNKVEQIKFFAQPQATLHPMKQVDHEALKIDGFDWQIKVRPRNLLDLYRPLQRKMRPVAPAAEKPARPTTPSPGVDGKGKAPPGPEILEKESTEKGN